MPVGFPPCTKKLASVFKAPAVSPDESELDSEAKSFCSGVELLELLDAPVVPKSCCSFARSACAAETFFEARSLNSEARSDPMLESPEFEPPSAEFVSASIDVESVVPLEAVVLARS